MAPIRIEEARDRTAARAYFWQREQKKALR